jgi:phospholipid transport system substrate-binding protein
MAANYYVLGPEELVRPLAMTPKFVMLLCVMLPAPVYAAVSDPAALQVQALNTSLLQSMHAGAALSMSERYRQLEPVIEKVFALPLVTRLSVGPDWTNLSPDQQKALIAAFTRYTIANYAHNFRDFDGQRFAVDDNVSTRGQDKVVRTQIIPAHDTPSILLYRMHEVDGAWKIIDVDYNGVSELISRRTDWAVALASGGASGLIAHLNKVSDDLMK